MKDFWNARYALQDFVYGKDPNRELETFLRSIPPGKILFPAEGEGRNAAFAASLGWTVFAFDQSEEAKKKADRLAKEKSVSIQYNVHGFENMDYKDEEFDCIALVFTHLPTDLRQSSFSKLIQFLKPGGILFLLGFSKNQLGKKSGGPQDLDLLFSLDQLKDDFRTMEFHSGREFTTILEEGEFHQGEASLLELIASKK
jgi:SAM-dependent methyltransferase